VYSAYFKLKESPFSLTPDPRFLFMSDRHREGLAHLFYGIQQPGGFVQLTGEIGSGKTTLCRSLVKHLTSETDIALILNPRLTAIELLASICDELGVAYPAETRSIKNLVDALNRRLLDSFAKGRRTVLVIDEAQNLHSDVLEQIRLLTNLETAQEKLLQIVLIGQPELLSVLRQEKLRQLSQRITARYHLTPLSRRETYAYILHRLSIAGRSDPLFTAPAMFHVYRFSRGVPRLINIICDRALLGAYALDSPRVTAGIVRRAHRETRGTLPWRRQVRTGWTAAIVALGVLTLGGAIFLGTDAVSILRRDGGTVGSGASAAGSESARPASDGKSNGAAESRALPPESIPVSGTVDPPLVRGSGAANVPDASAGPSAKTAGAEPLIGQPARESGVAAPSLVGLLEEPSLRGAGGSGFTSLYARLGIRTPSNPSSYGCRVEGDAGYDCLFQVGNWTKLRFFDLPAILKLNLPSGTPFRATLVGLGDRSGTLAIGGREYTFPLREIESVWDGSFILLWKLPFPPRQLAPGDRGAEVAWVRRTLDTLEGKAPDSGDSEVYDENLRRRVMAFQRERSLPQDGIVGNVTLVRLTLAVMGANAPSLSRNTS